MYVIDRSTVPVRTKNYLAWWVILRAQTNTKNEIIVFGHQPYHYWRTKQISWHKGPIYLRKLCFALLGEKEQEGSLRQNNTPGRQFVYTSSSPFINKILSNQNVYETKRFDPQGSSLQDCI